ncbi:MFS transporter [Maribellus sediminis]|uniref:MFS transporter n=1 Tax=Maribellus sediminis TaxID=2696285 RepID=UPI001431C9EE|nr:MFS transporter [Maribellus sediminis]
MAGIKKNTQYYKFSMYGFLKNLRFFDAFFILYLVEKGLPYTQIGILYAVREIVINVLEVPSGFAADVYGRKNALLGSFLAYIASFIIFYFSGSFAWFLAAFVFFGIGDAFRSGTHKAMIMDYLRMNSWEQSKIAYYGHTRSWSQMGSAISSLIAGFIVFYKGNYGNVFLYSIIPYLINLVNIFTYPKELNYTKRPESKERKIDVKSTFKSLYTVMKHKNVLRILNTAALHSAYLKAVKDYIQLLMLNVVVLVPLFVGYENKQRNGVLIGIFYFVIYLLTSRASRMAYGIASRYKTNLALITLLIGFGFGTLSGVFNLLDFRVLALVFFAGIYMVENLRMPILTGYITDHVPNDILASVISAQALLKTIMTAGIAVVFGFLADSFNIGVAFVTVSFILIVLSVLFTVLFKKEVTKTSSK